MLQESTDHFHCLGSTRFNINLPGGMMYGGRRRHGRCCRVRREGEKFRTCVQGRYAGVRAQQLFLKSLLDFRTGWNSLAGISIFVIFGISEFVFAFWTCWHLHVLPKQQPTHEKDVFNNWIVSLSFPSVMFHSQSNHVLRDLPRTLICSTRTEDMRLLDVMTMILFTVEI